MRIAVGGIIHSRSTVDCYLRHMAQLRAPSGVTIEYLWVIDGPDVDLADRIRTHMPQARTHCTIPGFAPYHRQEKEKSEAYRRLALLRNALRGCALKGDCAGLLNVDSDILAPPDLVERLLVVGQPWVSALVRNSPHFLDAGTRPTTSVDDHIWNVFYLGDTRAGRTQLRHFKAAGLGPQGETWPAGPVDAAPYTRDGRPLVAGAVCWYGSELLSRVEFEAAAEGEDVGFGQAGHAAGFAAWYIPTICEHLMFDVDLERHVKGCELCASRM